MKIRGDIGVIVSIKMDVNVCQVMFIQFSKREINEFGKLSIKLEFGIACEVHMLKGQAC